MSKEQMIYNFYALSPILGPVLMAVLILMVASSRGQGDPARRARVISQCEKIAFLAAAFVACFSAIHFATGASSRALFEGAYRFDRFAAASSFLFSLMAIATQFLAGREFAAAPERSRGEFFAMLLFALSGAVTMAASCDLVAMLVGIEILSLSTYVMTALDTRNIRAVEGAFKYFLMGAVSSAMFVFGLAHAYGATGSTNLKAIADALADPSVINPYFPAAMIGVGFITVAILFKIAAVPFHMWAPDAYDGATVPVAAFMTYFVKAAVFAAAYRLYAGAFPNLMIHVSDALAVVAVVTMTVANIAAIRQKSLKRMLAYSSVSHSGYLLMAFVAMENPFNAGLPGHGAGILFYLAAYFAANAGIFSVISMIAPGADGTHTLDGLRGIGFAHPFASASLTLFMLSLAGMPATGGFMAKFAVFFGAFSAGRFALVLFAVLNSLVAMYYYIAVIMLMYMQKPDEKSGMSIVSGHPEAVLTAVAAIVAVLATGLFPEFFIRLAGTATAALY